MINYPNKKQANINSNIKSKKAPQNNVSAANRGMDFEHAVTQSCAYYDDQKIAILTKRPTPIKILKTDYKKGRITDAVFEKQSNTDYNGVYKSRYVDFECKETRSMTSLSFNNIPSHQIRHLKKVIYHGGIAFFLIYFRLLNEVYLVDASIIIEDYEKGEKKSISLQDVKAKGYLVKQGYIPKLDFISIIDEVFFNEKNK